MFGLLLTFISSAFAGGEVSADLGLDFFHLQGIPAPLNATMAGARLRSSLETGKLDAHVDWRFRQNIGNSDAAVSNRRTLYQAEVGFDAGEMKLSVGRFSAPAVGLLLVDGIRGEGQFSEDLLVEAFVGRRGVNSSFENLGFDNILPAAGASATVTKDDGYFRGLMAFSGDELLFGTAEEWERIASSNLDFLATGWVRPKEFLMLGGTAARSQNMSSGLPLASFYLSIEDLTSLHAFAQWNPSTKVRFRVDGHHQQANIQATDFELLDPNFTDLKLSNRTNLLEHIWLRPEIRLRLRGARKELRTGFNASADDVVGGLFFRGRLFYDDIMDETRMDDVGSVDRLLWAAEVGYRHQAFDISGGFSGLERAANPVSGRIEDVFNPELPNSSEDLGPFVMEAQDYAFVKAFYGGRQIYGGLDFEKNLQEGEWRALIQVGAIWGKKW